MNNNGEENKSPEIETHYYADHDLTEKNILETAIIFEEEELDAIVIDTLVFYPFPEVAEVLVTAHNGLEGLDMFSPEFEDNLEHYARRTHQLQEAVPVSLEIGDELAGLLSSFEA